MEYLLFQAIHRILLLKVLVVVVGEVVPQAVSQVAAVAVVVWHKN
jgi:hypothetical protein